MFVKEIKLSKLSVISAENELMSIGDVIHMMFFFEILFKYQKSFLLSFSSFKPLYHQFWNLHKI
jgi:hypothetical protein